MTQKFLSSGDLFSGALISVGRASFTAEIGSDLLIRIGPMLLILGVLEVALIELVNGMAPACRDVDNVLILSVAGGTSEQFSN